MTIQTPGHVTNCPRGGVDDRVKPVPVGAGVLTPQPRAHRAGQVIESHSVRYPLPINGTRHVAVWATRCVELVIFSTTCGCTADSAQDDLDTPHRSNCPQCIPFRRTR